MEKVCVLMSSYNGEKYIDEQIESILSQRGVDVTLVIRDDGSIDDTTSIIKKHENVVLIEESNIGCEESFIKLLYLNYNADYYAFSDQDDYWHEDKLITGIMKLKQYDCPALYGSNLMICDDNMKKKGELYSNDELEKMKRIMRDYWIYNLHGCTQIWNKKLNDIIQSYKPSKKVAHDTWVNAIANICGQVIVDQKCSIDYRIHKNNTSGYSRLVLDRLKKAYRLYIKKGHREQSYFAQELLCGFEDLMDKEIVGYRFVLDVAMYKKSLISKGALIVSPYFYERNKSDYLFWIFCILINKY